MKENQNEKMSRIVWIQKPGINIQLSTECPEENMDMLIAKVVKLICDNKDE